MWRPPTSRRGRWGCTRSTPTGPATGCSRVRSRWPRRSPSRGCAARDVPSGLDLIHYPVTVPIPHTELPTVVTLLDVQHHDLPGFFSRAEAPFRRRAYDRAARDADVVVTISEFSKGRIVETLGISPERVEVVHLGVDHDRFTPDGPEPRARPARALPALPREPLAAQEPPAADRGARAGARRAARAERDSATGSWTRWWAAATGCATWATCPTISCPASTAPPPA